MPTRIEDYAMVGDGEAAALVSCEGSVDWLCWPRFDSPACFAALLGNAAHGHWQLRPQGEVRRTARRYLGDTLVLETSFENAEGCVTLIDFMPPRGAASALVRLVRGVRGCVRMQMELIIRFDYGALVPWVTQSHGHPTELNAIAGPDRLTLRTSVPLRGEDLRTLAEFEVAAGESVSFVLAYSASHLPTPEPLDVPSALEHTRDFWRDWSSRCSFEGPWREAVIRSLITLKGLIYAPTGGIVAAPTTSLPERLGGERNWDYRYCWLRDATFTLLSLMNAGYYQEADAWRGWLLRALAGAPSQAQIMYGVGGERRLTEWQIPWLPGYEGSNPVRIGNAAFAQWQLDVYGEVADALHHAREGHLAPTAAGWAVQTALTSHVEKLWSESDEGIWEVRGPRQHFTHSKVMAWVAIDRAITAAERHGLRAPLERWREVRRRIHADVCRNGFDERRGTFVQAYGATQLDASLLLIPLVGFLPPEDPRVRGTVEAIGRDLMVDGLIRRYHTEQTADGLSPGEGAFLACSFWYVDNLVLIGQRQPATQLFEHLLTLRNDVGLLAEEYDPRARRQLGNFPQAFSHVALIDSAHNLSGRRKPAEQRASHPPTEEA
jgi:GH15 family glucan-1,4-alpha-glucosidase